MLDPIEAGIICIELVAILYKSQSSDDCHSVFIEIFEFSKNYCIGFESKCDVFVRDSSLFHIRIKKCFLRLEKFFFYLTNRGSVFAVGIELCACETKERDNITKFDHCRHR